MSSSQETGLVRRCRRDLNGQRGRQAGRQAAKGKYRSGYPRPSIGPSLHVCFATVSITGSNASPFDLSCLDKLINADLRISFPILETVREIFQPRFCHALFVIYEGTGEWSVDSFQIRCRGGFSTRPRPRSSTFIPSGEETIGRRGCSAPRFPLAPIRYRSPGQCNHTIG